jgi:hypothetical protein
VMRRYPILLISTLIWTVKVYHFEVVLQMYRVTYTLSV